MPFLLDRPPGSHPPVLRVEGDVLLIGRGTNAGLRLDDDAVALEHARIERDPAGFKLADLGSVTGTYLNGKPVTETTYLKDGDVIGVGGWRLSVRWPSSADPLGLSVRPAVAETARTTMQAPEVDYAGAYTLRRPFLTKGALAVFLTLAALLVLAVLPLRGLLKAFQPGAVSEAHQRKNVGCLDCHAPWEGPATTSCSSGKCHPRSNHQATQATTPDCSDCHFEHRGQSKLVLVNDASCVTCHGNLKVKQGATPKFARQVSTFPEDHADFSLTLPEAGRLPVAEAVNRGADPGTLELDHAYHLKPGLISPKGRETLTCASCHQPGPGATGMKAVNYEQHCQRCHQLTFDDDRPDEEAPHEEPRLVRDRLVAIYGVNEGQMGSFRDRRRTSVRNPGAAMGINLNGRVLYQVQEAENNLYRVNCVKCHTVDLDARPFPTVAPARLQGEWLPFSHFDHRPHVGIKDLACETCHTRAAASRARRTCCCPASRPAAAATAARASPRARLS